MTRPGRPGTNVPETDETVRMGELSKDKDPEQLPYEGPLVSVGQWYWLKMFDGDKEERLACATRVGSNFVELHDPYGHYTRIHLDEFEKRCRLEPDPESIIRGRTEHYRQIVREKLAEIKQVTARLGVNSSQNLERRPEDEACRSLSVLSATPDMKKHKKELIRAKEKLLPALFEEVKEANENLVTWMKAQTIPMEGMIGGMEACVEKIDDRIFNVSLYAGLTEEVAVVRKGEPAAIGEKLRIMQRLCFMDEECLVNYRHGGMEFNHLGQFDRWLAEPENMDRILPYPRCMVAFRVRRGKKDRGPSYSLDEAYIKIRLEDLDKLTFLYIRNGERLYRMDCDLEFGELIFPGRDELNLDEPMMARMSGRHVEDVITERHYRELLISTAKEIEGRKVKHDEWKKKNPDKQEIFSPFRSWSEEADYSRLERDYEPFNPDSVYYDEIKGEIERRVKYYNRIALIVQGLYDRSEVLHPHPPVRLWSPEGFSAAVELVYADHALHFGDAPDFEAYRKAVNASLKKGCVTIGQEDFWGRREAKRENERMDRGWREVKYHHTTFHPYGDPGPGYIAEIQAWLPRVRKAVFRWTRKRKTEPGYWSDKNWDDPLPAAVEVPEEALFNVSAYKPGDFKQFYKDPRTRAEYLQWAPILIAAEEYYAGNLDLATGRLKEKKKKGRRRQS